MALLAGCGSRTACSGLTDRAAVEKVIDAYAAEPATQKGDPAQMQFSPARVAGIGRSAQPMGSGALIQIWFRQDDHTLTVATLAASCDLQFRPGLAPTAITDAVLPAKPPRF